MVQNFLFVLQEIIPYLCSGQTQAGTSAPTLPPLEYVPRSGSSFPRGFPGPSLPLVRPTLVCIFMFLLEHKAMEDRDHGLPGHLWVPSTSTGLHIQHNQSIFAEGKGRPPPSPSPGATCSEGTAKLSLDHHGENQCAALMLEPQPQGSALH